MKVKEIYEIVKPGSGKTGEIPPCISLYDKTGNHEFFTVYKPDSKDLWKSIPQCLKNAELMKEECTLGYDHFYLRTDIVIEGAYSSEERCKMDGYELVSQKWRGTEGQYSSSVKLYGCVTRTGKSCFVEVTGY